MAHLHALERDSKSDNYAIQRQVCQRPKAKKSIFSTGKYATPVSARLERLKERFENRRYVRTTIRKISIRDH